MLSNHCYLLSIMILLIINVTSREITLSPYALWNQTAVTIHGSLNGTNGSSPSQLSGPRGISITDNDILYVSDTDNHRIVVVDLNSTTIKSIIDSNQGPVATKFNNPFDVFVTNTSLYVLDKDNHRVQKLSLNGSNPTAALSLRGLNSSHYLYVDNHANIYVSDTFNHRVLFFQANSENYTIVAGSNGSGSAANQLNRPYGLFVSHNGAIYIADRWNHRIMKWISGNSSGIIVAGSGVEGNSSLQLSYPTQIILDTNDFMYISDSHNHRIIRWSPNSTFGVCIAACTGTNGISPTHLNNPHSLAFDSNGTLYVSDWKNHRIQKYQILDYHTIFYNQPNASECATWDDKATMVLNINSADLILVGILENPNGTVRETPSNLSHIVLSNNETSTSTGNNLINSRNLFIMTDGNIYDDNDYFINRQLDIWLLNTTTNDTVANLISRCTHLFIDIDKSFYCSMNQEHKVVKLFNNQSSIVQVNVAGNASHGSTSDLLCYPNGIFVSINLDLYVADSGNNRIQMFQPGNRTGETVAGDKMLGSDGLNYPTGIVLDVDGYLYIADCNNHRIIKSSSNSFRCIIGCHRHQDSAHNELHHPRALWFDNYNNLFVLHKKNRRIQKFLSTKSSHVEAFSSCLFTSICWDPTRIGVHCSISNTPCDIFQPCQNNGTCNNTNDNSDYNCLCATGFNGKQCEHDYRPCKQNTCWNNGTCKNTSSITFTCTCASGWEGTNCERMINYCYDGLCKNKGVCRPLLSGYLCECLIGSYSGQYCEITAMRIIIIQIAAKSFACIAIITMVTAVMFFFIMDILKYCFGIDPVEEDRQQIRQERRVKKQKFIDARVLKKIISSTNSDRTIIIKTRL